MGYNSPYGHSSIFDTDDEEFVNHSFSGIDHGEVVYRLRSSSAFEYNHLSHPALMTGSTRSTFAVIAKDGEPHMLVLSIGLNNSVSGTVTKDYGQCIIKVNKDWASLYVPFANQELGNGPVKYAIRISAAPEKFYDLYLLAEYLFPHVYAEKIFSAILTHLIDRLDENSKNIPYLVDVYSRLSPEFMLFILTASRTEHLAQILTKKIIGEKAEKAILNLLRSVAPGPYLRQHPRTEYNDLLSSPANYLLNYLVTHKLEKITLLERLYNKVNDFGIGGNNFSEAINLLVSIWRDSVYVLPNLDIYLQFSANTNIPYSNAKELGFNINDFSFEFKDTAIVAKQTVTKKVKDAPDDDLDEEDREDEPVTYSTVRYEKVFGRYHLLQPLTFVPVSSEGYLGSPDLLIPAFALKALDDKKRWDNYKRFGALTVDVLSIFIGAGVVLRVGRVIALLRTAQAAEALLITLGTVQVATGTVNFLLHLTEDEEFQKNNPVFYEKVRTWLMVIELASFGAEMVTVKMMAKASADVLDTVPRQLSESADWANTERELQRLSRGERAVGEVVAELVELTEKELKQLITSAAIRNRILKYFKELRFYKQGDEFVVMYEGEKLFAHSHSAYINDFVESVFKQSNAAKKLKKLKELAIERRLLLKKWLKKFGDTFKNHLTGDVRKLIIKDKLMFKIEGVGEGGHYVNSFIEVKTISIPPGISQVTDVPFDTPFVAKIDVLSANKVRFPKKGISSIFPPNWNYERLQQEVAWVYENTVAKGKGLVKQGKQISTYEVVSPSGFEIRIQIKDGLIINAHPVNL